ncbi:MAG: TraR/DksA C4-type zinc finger protein [Candidatus Pacebacteria bacterium]|nr:TraR/DksA C4-type zinc finger protein [Candidatus Paceibacterota bacterium]
MNKKTIKELKEKLEKQKSDIESELLKFAKEDKKIKGDWDTKYPRTDGGTGSQTMEDAADQVEEYANLLPVEHSLELRLKDINFALEKIKKNKYGKCEKCKKQIDEERLKVYPEARFCANCPKKR